MAGIAPSGGPFEKKPLGVETRDEKRLEDDSSPTASVAVDEEASAVKGSHTLGSTEDHIFADPVTADYWRKVYERAGYENRHRFDPSFQWSAEDEKKLIRKVGGADGPVHCANELLICQKQQIDWRIMLWAWIMFIALDIHRKNIRSVPLSAMPPEETD